MNTQTPHHSYGTQQFSTFLFILSALFLSGCAQKGFKDNGLEDLIERQQVQHEFLSEPVEKITRTTAELEEVGDRYLIKGDINRAYLYYIKGLETEPDNHSLRHKQAALLMKKNKLLQAEIIYKKLITHTDRDAMAYEGLGRIYLRQGKFEETELNLLRAIEIKTELWKAHNCLGLMYSQEKNFELAIQRFNTALTHKPGEVSVLNNLAVTHYLVGNFEETIRILSNLPTPLKDKKIYNNLALAYYQAGFYNQALEAFKKGSENKAVAYSNMGHKYLNSKKYTEAVKAFKRAIDLHPKYYPSAQKGLELARRLSQNINSPMDQGS